MEEEKVTTLAVVNNFNLPKYEKLEADKTDWDSVKEVAEVMNEMVALNERLDYLKTLLSENSELTNYIWKTKDNRHIAYKEITDDHLKNIKAYLDESGKNYPQEFVKEYFRRFGEKIENNSPHIFIHNSKIDEAMQRTILEHFRNIGGFGSLTKLVN